MNSVCLIYNFAPHYRKAIFSKLENKCQVDFYFGDTNGDIAKLDYGVLRNFRGELKNIKIWRQIYWQKGAVNLFFKGYSKYLVLGEYYCVSTWILLLMCTFSRNKKIYFWSHGWYGDESWIVSAVKRLFFNLCDGVFLYGNYAKHLMFQKKIAKNKMYVIYNSLNYDEQKRIRLSLKNVNIYSRLFKNNNPVVIFIGRLTKNKKLHQIISAVSLLEAKKIYLNVVMVGDGSEKSFLESQTKNLRSSKVWFYGECYDEVVLGDLLYNADICVSPGNVGLTAMHSLAFGTPVITHSNRMNQFPEFEAVIQNETGDFFEENDICDLARKIENWLKKDFSRITTRERCIEIIEKYYNADYQLEIFRQVIGQ